MGTCDYHDMIVETMALLLDAEQYEQLRRLSSIECRPIPVLVREAVDDYLRERREQLNVPDGHGTSLVES